MAKNIHYKYIILFINPFFSRKSEYIYIYINTYTYIHTLNKPRDIKNRRTVFDVTVFFNCDFVGMREENSPVA